MITIGSIANCRPEGLFCNGFIVRCRCERMIRIGLMILLCATVLTEVRAQEPDILFESGHPGELSFLELVNRIEEQGHARFFFREKWIADITVRLPGGESSLREILSQELEPIGLTFEITADRQVYIIPGRKIITELPDYAGSRIYVNGPAAGGPEVGLTNTEQRYIEGRKAGIRETQVIGSGTGEGSLSGAVINGKIADSETGEPLIGATIYVHELKKGAVTDVDGRFSIVLRPGTYTVDFNCMGMQPLNYYWDVRSGVSLEITMEKGLIPISEVVIEASRYHNVRGTQMGFERLSYKTVKEIPIVMGEKDLLKVAQMLPGVQSVGEGSSGFNVRGSAADQNMIYVNRAPLYNSSHLFGFFSSINPDIIKDFSLYKSNLPVSYGGRISSFFDISTRQGNMKKYTARGGISPVTGHVAVEGPIVEDKSAFVLSARSTYSDWILKRMNDPELRNSDALFYDLAGTLTYEPDENNLLRAFGYYSRDRFTLGSTNRYDYFNAGASVNLKHRFNPRISGDLALVFGEYAFQTTDESIESFAFSHEYRIDHYEARGDFSWLSLGSHKLSFGSNLIYYDLDRGRVMPYNEESLRVPVDLGNENGLEVAVYLADEITLGPRLTLYGGIRYSHYMALGPAEAFKFGEGLPMEVSNITDTLQFLPGRVVKQYGGPEPRLALKYLLGSDNSVKISYNRIQQFLFMLSNTIAISPTDQWKLCDYHIVPPRINQVSAGYYHDFPSGGISSSIEVYHKWASNIVEFRDGASFINNPHIEFEVLQGSQRAYGLELMLRKSTGKFNGWIAYSYSRSIMHIQGDSPGESINDGEPYPSNYDRPHNLNLVSNYRLNRRLSLSCNLVYITGRPVTYPVSIYYMDGMQYIHYSKRNQYRIPDYFRVDLSFNLEGNLRRVKPIHSYWMLNFYNLTGRKNAYSVYFKSEGGVINGYKLSIFGRPVITLSWIFKFGNYASE